MIELRNVLGITTGSSAIMLYDDKQIREREALYTVIGALVLAVVLFALLAAYETTRTAPTTDGRSHASAPDATTNPNE